MNSSRSSRRAGAFTLVELLLVIAIIGILASLLLPALNQSEARVKRIECESHLHQLGIAFQIFSHDHSDQFPMTVPASDGGSREFVQSSYAVGGEFYFSFRHFQVLSNELSTPAVLACSTDTRFAATGFGQLQNSNLSYFVDVKASFSKPDSILAGDRNITANSLPNPSILHITTDNPLRWTWELHQSKGNILFAGGQVEEWNNRALAGAAYQQAGADLFLPTVLPVSNGLTFVSGNGGNYSGVNPGAGPAPRPTAEPFSSLPAAPAAYPANNLPGNGSPLGANTAAPSRMPETNLPGPLPHKVSGGGTLTSNETDTATLTFDQRVIRMTRKIIVGTYLLLLLIFLLLLAFKAWQRAQRRREQQQSPD